MAVTISKIEITPTTIMVFYSGPVKDAANPSHYTIAAPKSGIMAPTQLSKSGSIAGSYDELFNVAVFALPKTTPALKRGDAVTLSLQANGVSASDGSHVPPQTVHGKVNGLGEEVEAVEDAVSYPLLTEEVTFPGGGGAGPGMSSPTSIPLSQTANMALSDVLGWKINPTDARGFVGALTQSFSLTEVEGHTEAAWTPRSYAVQTDLSGGITGAQASLYSMAKTALDQSLPLLDGLYPLDPEAEPEDVASLKELARSQMTEIVKELGKAGGPSTLRVDTYFNILIGTPVPAGVDSAPPRDADALTAGTLKEIRDTYGIGFAKNPFSNTIDDETNITNFRIVSDYLSSLFQTWVNNKDFFRLGASNTQAFLGTQLVLISRQFSVIVETVNEVRFTLNSVFIGPSERQTLLIDFSPDASGAQFDPMFLEDILIQIESFASDEGPRLIQNGGRHSVTNNVLPVVKSLRQLASRMRKPSNKNKVPDGFRTARVKHALDDLHDQLQVLEGLASGIGRNLPPPEGEFGLSVLPRSLSVPSDPTGALQPALAFLANRGANLVTNISIVATGFTVSPSSLPVLGPSETKQIRVTRQANGPTTGTLILQADGIEPVTVRLT